jgi:hypothetical protein
MIFPLASESRAHPASCTMGTGGSFPGGKARPGRDADRSPPSAEAKKALERYLLSPTRLHGGERHYITFTNKNISTYITRIPLNSLFLTSATSSTFTKFMSLTFIVDFIKFMPQLLFLRFPRNVYRHAYNGTTMFCVTSEIHNVPIFTAADRDSTFLRNADAYLQICMALQHRIPTSTSKITEIERSS